jgi:predicted MFS family arabinose efflux permease
MAVSAVMVALAPNFAVLMVGRALVGVVIGGFWSMSAATVMRLVPKKDVPQALALLNGGNALATTIAAPLGSFLGQFIGWRGAFFAVVPLAAMTLAWQFLTLPSMPAETTSRAGSSLGLLRRPVARIGMAAVALLFMGQFAVFTYLRPFLETVTRADVSTLSLILLGMGAAGLLGNFLIGKLISRSLAAALVGAPLALAAIALGLVAFGGSAWTTAVLLAGWGLIGTAAPVAWWTWLSRNLPDDAEAGGGLMVAAVQMAITLGAAVGGQLLDRLGYGSTFAAGATLLVGAAVLASLSARRRVAPLALEQTQ